MNIIKGTRPTSSFSHGSGTKLRISSLVILLLKDYKNTVFYQNQSLMMHLVMLEFVTKLLKPDGGLVLSNKREWISPIAFKLALIKPIGYSCSSVVCQIRCGCLFWLGYVVLWRYMTFSLFYLSYMHASILYYIYRQSCNTIGLYWFSVSVISMIVFYQV